MFGIMLWRGPLYGKVVVVVPAAGTRFLPSKEKVSHPAFRLAPNPRKTVASGAGYRAAAMFAPERRGGKIKFRLALPDGASHSFLRWAASPPIQP
jgi:hypothetical protein